MPDLNNQLRDYFDANVERVTAADVFAGRHVVNQIVETQPRWRSSPRVAAGFGFAVTVFVIGGSLGLGLALRNPADDAASGVASFGIGSGMPASTGWGLLGVAAVLALVAMAFMVLALRSARRNSSTRGRERAMSTTLDTPSADHKLEEAQRTNKWLIAAVVVLAVALVALGAWVVSDLTATNATEAPAEVQALLDGYREAWNTYDGEAFLGYVSNGYTFDDHRNVRDALGTATLIESMGPSGFSTELAGDYVFVPDNDATMYSVSAPNVLGNNSNSDSANGISLYRIVNFPNEGWKITYHKYVGEVPSL